MNLTSFGSCSEPSFSQYRKPYMVPFQNTQKILKGNLRFTRNSEAKRVFHKTIFSNWGFFWPWSLSFKITNNFFIWLWIDLIEGNGQNKVKELYVWGICSVFFLSFIILILVFLYVSGFICDIICLFKFRFSLFYVLKHVRLLDLIIFVFALFLLLLFLG